MKANTKALKAVNEATLATLTEARHNAVLGIAGGYGSTRAYAIVMNSLYEPNTQPNAPVHWFDVEHTFKDDFSLAVNTEKTAFYKELREVMKASGNETNPSVYWGRIRKAGSEERLGKKANELVEGGAEGEVNEGASGGADGNRSPRLRVTEESIKLFKFLKRQESLEPELIAYLGCLTEGMEKLGLKIHAIEV